MIREELIQGLKKAVKELTGLEAVPELETPENPQHGDYSSNIAMTALAKSKIKIQKNKTPLELAQKIVEFFSSQLSSLNFLERVEAVQPGFINFWLSKDYLINRLQEVLSEQEKLGRTSRLKDQKIAVEFGDPNPFKELHIGHLRNIVLGESLSRLLEAQGGKVSRMNYQGDVGLHVAKALYGLSVADKILKQVQNDTIEEKVKLLGEAYARGSKAYEEDEQARKEIQEINLKIYQNSSEVQELWKAGRQWSLDHFEEMYKRLSTKYDYYYFESQTAPLGRQLVLEQLQKGVFEKHEGAIVFRGEKYGLHTRVFVTKKDYATYEAKDLALAQLKYKDVAYDRSIVITAHEQASYFSVILKALELIFPDLAAKTIHYSFGFVSLKEGKMSSRRGDVITAKFLLDEAKKRIQDSFKEMDWETAEKVAVGAVKYSMLKFSRNADISFSFDESISLEGDSGPYLQYTFARTQSVLTKIKNQKSKIKTTTRKLKVQKLEPEEVALLRKIHRFPEVVSEAAENFAPNLLCSYLFDLAQKFNLFYQKHPIIDPSAGSGREAQALRGFRLALTASLGQVLKNGLYLLGIEAPERM